MLRPIPGKILKHTVTLNICTGVDRYQEPTFDQQEITHCVMQPTNATNQNHHFLFGFLFFRIQSSF